MKTLKVQCNQNPFKYMAELARKKGSPQRLEAKRKLTTSRENVELMPPFPWEEPLVSVIQGPRCSPTKKNQKKRPWTHTSSMYEDA